MNSLAQSNPKSAAELLLSFQNPQLQNDLIGNLEQRVAERTVELEVLRYNPETDSEPHFQRYTVPCREEWVVLDALNHIKETIDPYGSAVGDRPLEFDTFADEGYDCFCGLR